MKKVLVIVPSVTSVRGAGGVAIRWGEYVQEMKQNGWFVNVWTVDGYNQIPRFCVPYYPDMLADLPTVGYTWRLLNAIKNVDVVVSTDMYSSILIGLCCLAYGVPYVCSFHTDIVKSRYCDQKIINYFQKITVRLSKCALTTSPSFSKELCKRGVDVTKWYKPVPVSECFKQCEDDLSATRIEMTNDNATRTILLYVGRWSPEKRIHLLTRAIPDLCTLCILGDGSMAEEIESWHNGYTIVVLRGFKPREELVKYYSAADWIVSASDFETFGNVPYEAAFCGTPAILQDAQGFVDQIDPDGYRGALVNFDSPEAINQVWAIVKTSMEPKLVVQTVLEQSQNGTTITKEIDLLLGKKGTFNPDAMFAAFCCGLFFQVILSLCKLVILTKRNIFSLRLTSDLDS